MTTESPLLVFHHIPKTAGTSMRLWLWTAFGRERVFWHGEGEDGFLDDAVASRGGRYFERYAVVGGHVPFSNASLHALPRRKVHAAVLRRPAEQVVSHFEFASRQPHHPLHAGDDLERALSARTRFLVESINMQCRYASDRETAAAALAVFDRNPFILGCFDRLDLFVEHIAALFDVRRVALPLENVQAPGYFQRHYTPRASALIASITAEDEALYRRVYEKGVLCTAPRVPVEAVPCP